MVPLRGKALTREQRFQAHCEASDDGCIHWTGGLNPDGYGKFLWSAEVGVIGAHRAGWMRANGPIPVGMAVLHKCDVPRCVNPEHLFLGTQVENIADMDAKGRRNRWPSKEG